MRRAAALAVLALAGLLAALGWHRFRARPSDEEQVRQVFLDAARAAEEGRVGDALAAVSERFQGEGLDRQGVKQLLAWHAIAGDLGAVAVLGTAVRLSGEAAEATVDVAFVRGVRGARANLGALSDASAQRVEAVLAREGGAWRVVSARWRPIGAADAIAGPPP